jgi:beta-glucosidase
MGTNQCHVKHFIANEQELYRLPSNNPDGTVVASVSSNLDDKTLHELYMWPFVDAIHAGTTTISEFINRPVRWTNTNHT